MSKAVMYDNWMTPPPMQFLRKHSLFSANRKYLIDLKHAVSHYDISMQTNEIIIKHKLPQPLTQDAINDLENLLIGILFGSIKFKKGMSLYVQIGKDELGITCIEFKKPSTIHVPLTPMKIDFPDFNTYTLLYMSFFIANRVPGDYYFKFNSRGEVVEFCVNTNHPYLNPASLYWDAYVSLYVTFYKTITSSVDIDLYIQNVKSKYQSVIAKC